MLHKVYTNFVNPANCSNSKGGLHISGTEAKHFYLEEVKEVRFGDSIDNKVDHNIVNSKCNKKVTNNELLSDKNLFYLVQNNKIENIKFILNRYPNKINIVDEFGWSLLMIACQSNSIETVKELLKRGIDTSIRDKAGNSANSLVIKNKNFQLADILLSYKSTPNIEVCNEHSTPKKRKPIEYKCEICENQVFPDKQKHLSSTVHNLNASKGKKTAPHYVIPESNKGYQIMLKVGWDKEVGLGPAGLGKRYPIRTVMKSDRKGLGLKTKVENTTRETSKYINKKLLAKEHHNNKQMEINFRRQFY
ncbi:unnamed protein product [Leptidea sinapis]|uniref:G-patch domain-containing protein n=1 Tax=Leptidea sinapis TaxID=189913 RepID=A0A5E4PTZ1_9NEOP|nr:unnamed protein product [Leptidea sinapis]